MLNARYASGAVVAMVKDRGINLGGGTPMFLRNKMSLCNYYERPVKCRDLPQSTLLLKHKQS